MLLTLGLGDGATWSQDSFRVLSLTLSEMGEGERAEGGREICGERWKGQKRGN